jgi:hypothetical protein
VRIPPTFEKDENFFALKFVFGIDDKNQTVTIEKFADVLAYYGPLIRGMTFLDVVRPSRSLVLSSHSCRSVTPDFATLLSFYVSN